MPENNPLHLDMRVREYLKFRARLKGLGWRRSRERVETVMGQCGLIDVHRRIIGHLSKGYRQRVGLADALVHEPDLIILDEPTLGLDPHQIRAVRGLIKQLGADTTILLSTHILPEVEMTCSRVIILNHGQILAADTTENLEKHVSMGGQVIAEISAPLSELIECWRDVPEIEHCDIVPLDGEWYKVSLTPRNGGDLRHLVFAQVRAQGWELRELVQSRYSLEDIFIHLTRGKRPEEESR